MFGFGAPLSDVDRACFKVRVVLLQLNLGCPGFLSVAIASQVPDITRRLQLHEFGVTRGHRMFELNEA